MKSLSFGLPARLSAGGITVLLVLALTAFSLLPAAANPVTENPAAANAWLDRWVSQKGTTKIEVRSTADGLYEVAIVWVSEDADARVKESLGKILASGFTWDARKGEFSGGTLLELKGSECRLVPEDHETLGLIVKKGILSRTIPWTRATEAQP